MTFSFGISHNRSFFLWFLKTNDNFLRGKIQTLHFFRWSTVKYLFSPSDNKLILHILSPVHGNVLQNQEYYILSSVLFRNYIVPYFWMNCFSFIFVILFCIFLFVPLTFSWVFFSFTSDWKVWVSMCAKTEAPAGGWIKDCKQVILAPWIQSDLHL